MVMAENLDKEWIYLIVQAKELGITIAEIRTFLRQEFLADVSPLESKKRLIVKSTQKVEIDLTDYHIDG